MRRMSRLAFGQAYRLELMLAIARSEDGLVTLSELAKSLHLSASQIQRPFTDLIDLGLITRLPDSDSRHKFLIRNPSVGWAWAEEMATHAAAADTAPTPRARNTLTPHKP